MHNILDSTYNSDRGKFTDPTLVRLLNMETRNIEKAQRWYRAYGAAVNSEHPLLRLIYSFLIKEDQGYLDLYQDVEDNRNELANVGYITNPINRQKPTESKFYPNCKEFLISIENYSYNDVSHINELNWMELEPLVVFYQPYILESVYLPTGDSGDGLWASIGVDIAALAVMYLGFIKANLLKEETLRESPEQFIGRYVLPNMLISQFNAGVLNILDGISRGDERLEALNIATGGFAVTTYIKDIIKRYEVLIGRLVNRDIYPEDYLDNIPVLGMNKTLLDILPRFNTAETMANYTAMFMAYISYVDIAIRWSGGQTLARTMGKIKYMNRLAKNRNVLGGLGSNNLKEIIEQKYQSIVQFAQ